MYIQGLLWQTLYIYTEPEQTKSIIYSKMLANVNTTK